jgi:amino acid permease
MPLASSCSSIRAADPLASISEAGKHITDALDNELPEERAKRLEALYQIVDQEVSQDEQLHHRRRPHKQLNGHRTSSAVVTEEADVSSTDSSTTTELPPQPPSSHMIIMGAAANLCSATLGAGVLALPYAMKEAGIVVGLGLLVASALVTILSIQLLVAAQEASNVHHTMEGLACFYLGLRTKKLVEVCIVIFCLGCAVSYVIAVGDILYITLGWHRLSSMILLWSTLMMPLSMFRHMRSFQWTSGTGVAAIGTLIFSAFLHLMNDDYGQEHDFNRWTTNDTWAEDKMYGLLAEGLGGNSTSDDTSVVLLDYLWPANGVISVLKACPIVMFAFSCQINVPSIYHELPDQKLMPKVVYLSVTVCFLLYASISIIALADFGSQIEPNILVNYKHDSGMMQFACACMAAAVITAFPLNIFPARITILGVWTRYVNSRICTEPNEVLTAALLEEQDETASAGSDGSQYGAIGRSMSIDEGSDGSNGVVALDRTITEVTDAEDDESTGLRFHIVATLLLTGVALGFAILIPNISIVFGLLGGTTTSMLGYVIPGALSLRLHHRRLISSFLLVGGILISILTTSVTVYTTLTDSG